MGSASSKAARTGRVLSKAAPAVQKQATKPDVAPSRASPQGRRPDGFDPQERESADLLERLRHISPVEATPQRHFYQPASNDNMSHTLSKRQTVAQSDELAAAKGDHKTLLPAQTIATIVQMLNGGASHQDIIQTFQIDPSVLEKLSKLSVPQAVAGVRR